MNYKIIGNLMFWYQKLETWHFHQRGVSDILTLQEEHSQRRDMKGALVQYWSMEVALGETVSAATVLFLQS
jgi:hypothetical protein